MKIEGHLNIIEQEARSLRARLKNMVEVVRCKDCSLNEYGKCRLLVERDPNTDHRIWSGFFCAYGERK